MNNVLGAAKARLGAVRVAVMGLIGTVAASTQAHADSLGTIASNIESTFQNVGNLVIGASFLGGVGLTTNGLFMLKKASESQGQVPYTQPLIRIGVGAGLAAVPAVVGVGVGTLWNGSETSSPTMQSSTFTN